MVSKQWNQELPKIKNLKVYFIDQNSQLIVGSGIILATTSPKTENAQAP